MEYKKILITGTGGFIGYHLANRLLKEGKKIVGVDCMNDYYDPRMKEKRNKKLLVNENYKFYQIDFSVFDKIDEVVEKEKPDLIIHLAAQAGVRYSIDNPWAYESANTLGTMNIFETAKKHNIKRVLFASSSSVYGANEKAPFAESDRTDHQISLYAASKKGNEVMAYSYHHLYGMEVAGFRFFTVYGKMSRPDMAMFKFAKNMLLDKEIDVYNNGEMGRDFTYIDDIVSGIIGAMNKVDL
ncbi:MAG: NAD-dependent epimerase/dehydratase family protein, partial [Nanoarchaeota archaeon]|nr:NAD-dependent epimerase/dehydratase family protein [Nanoarchaeota archaeon]